MTKEVSKIAYWISR